MFQVTFSDGRTIEIPATCEDDATRKAYRIDPVYSVTDVKAVA